jgi:allantoin racemase
MSTVAILGSNLRWSGGRPPAYLDDAARGGASIAGIGLRAPLFPYTPADHVLVEAVHLEAGFRALDVRPGAIFIDTFGDYALDALRSALGVPIVGAGEASLVAAARHGKRFGIVTVWPSSLAWLYDARLARNGATANCVGVTYTGSARSTSTDGPTVIAQVRDELTSGAMPLLDQVIADCRAAIARGADSIVLGCTCMAAMYDQVADALRVPVVCPSRAGLAASIEAAVRYDAAGRPGDRAPDPQLAARVRAAVAALSMVGTAAANDHASDDVPADAGTGCPVCIVEA